ncbi:MAG: phosphonate ABC transporter, permease protein PhnE [Rhodobacteraceae bacterium]|nr:MAG: phosphonate ABC transporter, permease protein PhnE [Paracoccaceae bacterium]
MPVIEAGDHRVWRRRDRAEQLRNWLIWLVGTALFIVCWRFISERTIWIFVLDAPQQAWDMAVRMSNPPMGYFNRILQPMWDTVNMATIGTLIAIAIATPVAFLAASNTTPSVYFVRPVALAIIVTSRSINALIWALLLVLVVGPGLLAGIIAIALRSIGFIGKLLYEAIEEIDETQVEAIRATGAQPTQVLSYGIWPQVLPAFAGISVYRWDINIREATILGLVGAGGIGVQLQASVNSLAWGQVSVIFMAILVTVVFSEWVSAKVRHAVL